MKRGARAVIVRLRRTGRKLHGVWRALLWAFWLVYFSFVATVLALRYVVLPHIEDYRPRIEQWASSALGQELRIGRIEASWYGINPDLTLIDVRIADARGRPALAFDRVEAILSWWSVPRGELALRLLRIDEPTLSVRRDGEGTISIAGIALGQQSGDNRAADWILKQRRIRIAGATLVWQDELRQAPDLILEDVSLALDNDGSRHRFVFTALPPPALASKLDVRGEFHGNARNLLNSGAGLGYAEIDYADLAVWRLWLDYPVALTQGRGALRTWLDFAQGRLRQMTADVALRDVRLRLHKELPELALDAMSGRLGGQFSARGFAVTGRQLSLAVPGGEAGQDPGAAPIRIDATDFDVDWLPAADGQSVVGGARASRVDLTALARLAAYLPLDSRSRQWLAQYAPQGQVSELSAKWKSVGETLRSYTLKAGFSGLGLKANGAYPGFSGLAGNFEASEAGGSLSLAAQKSTIDLPGVFPVSLTSLDALSAKAKWKVGADGVVVDLARLDFSGPDAAGSAQGTYRSSASGPGVVDLTAALTRADARAVWRYMPHSVGQSSRDWLRDSLLAGTSPEAKLILKGDLKNFPFLDKRQGQFLVTVKARDAVVDYAKGWPRIEGISGELRFEGNGMVVDATRGSILGAQLSRMRAEIPNFDAPVSTLIVKGGAAGPTSEFLSFIARSPVADRIDHFTDDMRATGSGELDLGLVIPLDGAKLGDSKIEGTYRFINNEVVVDDALPPIRQVNGSLQFSGRDLRVPEINGNLFGGPIKIKGGLQKDGRVLISANGSVNVEQLRKLSDAPLLGYLAGTTSYRGEVRINKRNADLVIDSTLQGLASTLPEPLAKSASETLSLRFEKKNLANGGRADPSPRPAASAVPVAAGATAKSLADAAPREQVSVSLGNGVAAQLIRRKQRDVYVVERGALAVGRPLQLPASGIALGITADRLDLDRWRKLAATLGGGATPAASGAAAPTLDAVSIKAKDLLVFGRHLGDVDANASATPGRWAIHLDSQQAVGDLIWDEAGGGKLSARMKQVTLSPATPESRAVVGETVDKLPALDIVADEFSLGARRFGRVEVQARNEGGGWHLSRVLASNPYGKLSGSGMWRLGGGQNRTQLDFTIDSSDVGKLLERLGYPGTVRGGTARLGGKIGWNSAPTDLDFSSLSGEMALEAGKGQFLKLDPGAAGKLLGLISLQGLPRRITLDFKDVFSDGLAFDSIASKLSVSNGVMRTDRLQIDATSARVVMRGEVDLQHETQRLNINVQPELGTTAAIGIGLINPLAGVATLLANKVFQNPLNQMFGFDYLVSGAWDDPKVERLSGAASAPQRLPTIDYPSGANNDSKGE